jgi:hypothetical protein
MGRAESEACLRGIDNEDGGSCESWESLLDSGGLLRSASLKEVKEGDDGSRRLMVFEERKPPALWVSLRNLVAAMVSA